VQMHLTNEHVDPGTTKHGWAHRRAKLLRPLLAAWLGEGDGVDVTEGLRAMRLAPEAEDPVFVGLALRLLHKLGRVDLARLIEPGVVLGAGGQFTSSRDLHDLRRLEPWLWFLGPRALACILP